MMNELFQKYIEKLKNIWTTRTRKQKLFFAGSVLGTITLIAVLIFLTTRTTLVPLYGDLSPSETGVIKEKLDERGIKSEITDGGKTIKVPEELVNTLKVELAAEGIPKSGTDYSFFSQNAGIGMTDNEFNVLKLEATQNELANLLKEIDGVKSAKVMINLPEKGIFVSDQTEEASASIVLNTKPGYQFEENQIKALYHLVSKSLPNLPTDNIVIMNQYFEYFELNNSNNVPAGSSFATQHEIKKQIERDLQRQVQSMLGTMMGQDKVVVSVTTDIDFTQENRQENLVTPVDEENMEGIAISAQRLTETFTGNADQVGGIPQGEDPADALGTGTYLEGTDGNGEYERIEETINNEVNRIRKDIVESPYKIRDLGIQVMIEPPVADDPNSFPQERLADIQQILGTIVRTSIDKNATNEELTDNDIQNKIVVSVQPLAGKIDFDEQLRTGLPLWTYIVGGVLLLIIGILLFLFIRSRRRQEDEEIVDEEDVVQLDVPDVNDEHETESSLRKKQLEKMAKDKPEDFAKLLRSWLTED